jgi:folate-binding protein YgfZ
MASLSEQVAAARSSVLLVFEPELAVLAITGKDRATWLNGLVTCDVLKLKPAEAEYGLAVTQKGRIVTDLYVVAQPGEGQQEERLLVVLPRSVRDAVAEMLDRHLIMEDAELAPMEGARVAFAHGPRSAALSEAARASGAVAVAAACDPTGLRGALFVVEGDALLEQAAREVGGVVGDAAGWEALRLERGVPRFGIDFDDKTYPQEAALEKRAVSFDKGCYLGQEVVCMLELRGHVKRKLVPIVLGEGASAPAAGTPVLDAAGVEVGKLSSVGTSPTLSRGVGLAMVKLASAAPGTMLRVAGSKAQVVERPA